MDTKDFISGIESGNITVEIKTTTIQPVPNERRILSVSQNRWNPATGEMVSPEVTEVDIDNETRTLANMIERKVALTAEVETQQAYVDELNSIYNA